MDDDDTSNNLIPTAAAAAGNHGDVAAADYDDTSKNLIPTAAATGNRVDDAAADDDDDISNNLIPTAAAAVRNRGDDPALDEILKEKSAKVEWLLDRNYEVIGQINENQRSRNPQIMSRNADLISELESNMKKLVQAYSFLSANFTAFIEECLAAYDDDTSYNLIATAAAWDYLGDDAAVDVEVLESLNKKYAGEYWLLDRICQVIQQINENKRSRNPQNMLRNVDLMSELESKMEKLVPVNSILSVNVSALDEECLANAEAVGKI